MEIKGEITMTQEEKQLLLKDLAARLPYGVKCQVHNGTEPDIIVEEMLEELLNYCDTSIQYNGIKSPQAIKWKKRKEWFKSIKDRVQPKQKQEWNEKDKCLIDLALWCVNQKEASYDGELFSQQNFVDAKYWLKSLRPQKQDVMSVDEFRRVVGYLVQDIVANEHMVEAEKQPTKFFVEKYYNKLRPQTTWKPSEEQMNALLSQLPAVKGSGNKVQNILQTLYNDLKAL